MILFRFELIIDLLSLLSKRMFVLEKDRWKDFTGRAKNEFSEVSSTLPLILWPLTNLLSTLNSTSSKLLLSIFTKSLNSLPDIHSKNGNDKTDKILIRRLNSAIFLKSSSSFILPLLNLGSRHNWGLTASLNLTLTWRLCRFRNLNKIVGTQESWLVTITLDYLWQFLS